MPPTREETRAEILTPPDLVNIGPLGRPAIASVAGLTGPAVPTVTMGT